MTHQYKDLIIYNQKELVLIDTEDGKLIYDLFNTVFKLEEFSDVCSFSSALHRGHQERYEIIGNQLWGQMIERHFNLERDKKKWYETTESSDLRKIPYTGSCVISKNSYSDDWLSGYLKVDEAYELHFTEGILDEAIDLREAINFYNDCFINSKFYKDNDDQRSLHLKYDDAIAFHYLKYTYDPYDSMYWRNTRDRFFHLTDEDRKRKRQEFESNYQELIMKIKSI